jgi:integrase
MFKMKKKNLSEVVKIPRMSFQEIGQTIYARIHFQGKELKFSTNIINSKGGHLDTKTGILKGDTEATRLLITYRDRMMNYYEKSLERNKKIDLRSIKNATLGEISEITPPTLIEAIDQWFDFKYHQDSGFNRWTIEKNGYIVDNIKSFIEKEYPNKALQLDEIESIFAEKLINYLKNVRRNQHDHAVRHAKTLKSVFAFAQDNGWIEHNKFANKVYARGVKKAIHYLTEKEIQQLIELRLYSPNLQLVKDLYVFSCYTGLSFADIMNLQNSDIKTYDDDGLKYISKARQKGNENENFKKKIFYAPILPEAEKILNKYQELTSVDSCGRYFPRISNQQVNRTLKDIAVLANIQKPEKVTFHSSRRTCASLLYNYGVPISVIAKVLGHSSEVITLTYYAEMGIDAVMKEIKKFQQRRSEENKT